MSAMTDPPKPAFRLSQLIYDTRYRSITIQVVAFALIAYGIWALVSNTIGNLADLGKDFDFGFLGQSAGYDINQMLIPYDNQDTHGRAALVGIANTLLVAVMGCVTALVIGVLAGVARLSKNWVVAKLMAVYVEGFRNIPLLLWILLIHAVVSEALPQPNAFRGADPSASMLLGDSVALTGRGFYFPRIGFTNSLSGTEAVAPREGYTAVASGGMDWLVILGVLAVSLVGIKLIRNRASRIQESTGVRPTTWYTQLGLLIIPTGIVLTVLGATIVTPYLKGFNFTEGMFLRSALVSLWVALSLYTGAFIAETVRAGILSVSKGQSEAAAALGMQPGRTMSLVILPQAMRVIIPPLISQFLNLTKNSSLALAVGYMDVRATLGGITIAQTGRELEGMLLLGAFYLTLSLVISGAMNIYNNSTKLMER
ncbi:general L-amino acid transport system permease protein [Loktanella ponticola]|uniref:General L-amino acid transport system permease protein n=1 Tax=Yoonia ponticola TaxID=1524255 RepID=A0A7W9EWM9_9RHOB|nr:ABC transporter permease subunit [Yoonia ponticola]MBB5720773.1 general L-amino acid transport system permease protein [Yoonia ponticola]